MSYDASKVTAASDYNEYEEEPIILPIPYDDEAAEEARMRAAAAQAELERIEALKNNAAEIVPLPDATVDLEANQKAAEAEAARKAAEAALAAAQEAKRNAEAAVAEAQLALDKKRGLEAAAEAVKTAEVTVDAEGNSYVKIKVPKDYDIEFFFRPKASRK